MSFILKGNSFWVVIFIGWRLKKKDIEETLSINGIRPWYLSLSSN